MRKAKYKAASIIILLVLFVIYLIVLLRITIFRDSNSGLQSVNLIPFITIAEYLQSILRGNKIIGLSNILGNLIIFVPLGYMSALLFPKMRKLTRIFVLAVSFSVGIEVLQYTFACGSTDIDDVILNTLGGVAGYWLYAFISRYFKSKKYAIFMSASMIAVTCIGFLAFNNYRFLLPMAGNLPARAERQNEDLREPVTTDEPPLVVLPAGTIITDDFQTNAASTADSQSKADIIEWHLILVNKWNYIPKDYEVELVELTEMANNISVDKRIYPALKEMFDTARSDGVYPIVVSGYRTAKEQQRLLDNKISDYKAEGYSAEDAIVKAEAWVAVPGTSEHQLGIAIDVNADGIHSTGYEVYEWLGQNACKFGFIRRYPPDKTEITGVINEPWHYRYVGVDTATEMYNRGICLEEYLDK